jgi:hypothetical protein
MHIQTVDDFVKCRVLPEHQDIVAKLRELMKKSAPNAKEVISHGILAWKARKILALISPTKKDITLAFSRGACFEDKYGLLTGEGHVSRHVKIKDAASINEGAFRYYVKQALEFDAK